VLRVYRIKSRGIDAREIRYCRLARRNYPLINNRPSFISSYDGNPSYNRGTLLPLFHNLQNMKKNMLKSSFFTSEESTAFSMTLTVID